MYSGKYPDMSSNLYSKCQLSKRSQEKEQPRKQFGQGQRLQQPRQNSTTQQKSSSQNKTTQAKGSPIALRLLTPLHFRLWQAWVVVPQFAFNAAISCDSFSAIAAHKISSIMLTLQPCHATTAVSHGVLACRSRPAPDWVGDVTPGRTGATCGNPARSTAGGLQQRILTSTLTCAGF